ncbi:MAG TPA: hypothetical protein VMU94_00160 [Streptosporangiaceae bacterium]|nr:hypothetical protein [Streptosporangiaceae bacterium]
MFVHAELTVDVGFQAAAARMAALGQDGWLTHASADAYDSGLTGLARVGPRGDVRGMSKLVRVYARDLLTQDHRAVLTLRWEATGASGALFPALDADITLTPAGPDSSLLTLDGAYRPPLAALGASLDRVVLHRVATPTARSLLSQIAESISEASEEPA